jgi:hypothetical protein
VIEQSDDDEPGWYLYVRHVTCMEGPFDSEASAWERAQAWKGAHGKPAMPAERNAMKFLAQKIRFAWTDEAWASTHLPAIRAAVNLLQQEDTGLEASVLSLNRRGKALDLRDELFGTKKHLEALTLMLNMALRRLFVVSERLGYIPDDAAPMG